MEELQYDFFVGIDWASEVHDLVVIDKDRKKLFKKRVVNSFDGLGEMTRDLLSISEQSPARVAVAIEIPHGPIVELLVEHGFHVYSINPKQLDRFRDRHTTIGAKDDSLDAFVLADSVRTDLACFRRVQLSEAELIVLKELSRLSDELTVTRRRLANQLLAQLMRFAPELLKVCPAADALWFWELLGMAANPADAAKVKPYKVKNLLSAHRIRKVSPEEAYEAIRNPRLAVAPGVIQAALLHIKVLLAQLKLINEEQKNVAQQLKQLLSSLSMGKEGEHRDAAIILSLPGAGNLVAATLLSEASQAIKERDYETLRSQAGIAPVTKRSGKRLLVNMRYACNGRLREALYHCSRVNVQNDPVSRHKYSVLRGRGHSHGRALRSIGDGLLRLIIGMLKSNSLFDTSQRQKVRA